MNFKKKKRPHRSVSNENILRFYIWSVMLLDLCYRDRALLEEHGRGEIPPSPSGYHVATLPSFLSLTPQPFPLPQLCQKCFPSIIWQSRLILHQVSTPAPHKGFSSLSSYLKYCLWLFSKFSIFLSCTY